MQVLKSFQTDDEIFQLLNTLTLDQTVSGKVEQYKPGKFRFLTGFQEGLQLEFKQSVFSPNLTEIKNIKDTNVYNREKNKLEWNLKYRIIGSACALLNTEGVCP